MKAGKCILYIALIAVLFSPAVLIPAVNASAAGLMVMDSYSGPGGTPVTVRGAGFSGSSSYAIRFGTGAAYSQTVAMGTVNADGSFTAYFVVPDFPGGSYTVSAATDVAENTSSAVFAVTPSVTVSPAGVSAGGRISVAGSGFAASSTVSFKLDDVSFAAHAGTNSMGTFAPVILVIPPVPGGSHTLTVTDGSGASATAQLATSSSITVEPLNGPAGTIITVTGQGFKANHSISLTYDGAAVDTGPRVIDSDVAGNFTAAMTAPGVPAGAGVIAAGDGTYTASAGFVSSAAIYSDMTGGEVGSSVPVSGSGFTAGANLAIRLDNVQIATALAGSSGAFSTSVIIPPSRSGARRIEVTDGVNSGSLPFNITPGVRLSPESVNVGTAVTVKGFSFEPGSMIAVKCGAVQLAAAPADLNGTFSAVFYAPPAAAGNHTVIITDGGTIVTSSFIMESAPPPVPVPVSPQNGVKADALAEFLWQPVSDPSGVTYSLQIARDAGFNDILVDRTGLESPGYELSAAERLGPAGSSRPYYWRVRAVDGASNAGAWSTPQTFTVGFTMPAWGWYLIIAAAAVAVFALGLFLGRRLSSRLR